MIGWARLTCWLMVILALSPAVLAGIPSAPVFSHTRGFYAQPLQLSLISVDSGTVIRFTTDGGEPTSGAGQLYVGPIAVDDTMCVRAAAFAPDGKSSRIVTHTYLVGTSEAVRSLPVLSLVGDERETFYNPDGICAIHGGQYTSNYVSWRPVDNDDYNFPMQHGWAFERPISAELIHADGTSGFQADCGIRVNGSTYTRSRYRTSSKFSFRLYFRSDYGPAKLNYPLIPQIPTTRFDRVVLRAGQSDAVNPFIKDELGRRLQRDMSGTAALGTLVNLLINGRYRGYYNPTERLDEKMFQSRFGDKYAWDVVTQWRPEDDDYGWQQGDPVDRPYRFDARDGDPCDMNALLDYVLSHDLRVQAYYSKVARRLDVKQFIDYLILEGYLNHRDWPHNNWTATRARCSGDLGRWRFYTWDLEHCFYEADVSRPFKTPRSGGNVQPVGILYEQLSVNDEFKRCFADAVQRHFFNGGALTAKHVTERFEVLRETMAGVLPNMDASISDTWASQRPISVLDSLQRQGLLTFEGPRIRIDGTPYEGQRVAEGSTLTLENPSSSGTVWFTLDGTDPRLPVEDESDSEGSAEDFSDAERGHIVYEYWLDVAGSNVSDLTDLADFPGYPTGSQSLSRFESPVRWADNYGARVYGYLYPETTGDYSFWIASDNNGELYLSGDGDPYHAQRIAHVSGWTSPQEWDKQASQQSAPIRLEAGRRYYIEAIYKEQAGGDHVAVAWQGPGIEREVIDGPYLGPAEIDWTKPPTGDSGLYEIAPTAVEYTGQEIVVGVRTVVKARVLDDGLWSGLTELTLTTGPYVFINEIMAANVTTIVDPGEAGQFPDWIELYNPTNVAIDLGGLYLSDDERVPMKYRIPSDTTVEPAGFIVFWADGDSEQGPLHLPFRIDRDGEWVGLYDAHAPAWVDLVSVPALAADQSWGRVVDGGDLWIDQAPASPNGANSR